MKYFGIRDQDDKLVCVATVETIKDASVEVKAIFKNDDLKICEINAEDLDKFIKEWADVAGIGTKLLCHTIVNERGL